MNTHRPSSPPEDRPLTTPQAARKVAWSALVMLGLAGPPVMAADEDQIRGLLAEQTDAWNRGDATAWARDFSPDADFINILGMHFHDREQVEKRHAELFRSIFKGSQLAVTVWKVRVLSPISAVAETVHELKGYARLPPAIRPTDPQGLLRTRMKYVFVKASGQWVIVSAQNTAVAPSAPPAQ